MTPVPPSAPRLLRVRTRSYGRLIVGLLLIAAATVTVLVAVPYGLVGTPGLIALFLGLMAGIAGLFLTMFGLVGPRWHERDALVGAQDGYVTLDGAPLRARISGARAEQEAADARWRVALFTGSRHPTAHVYFPTFEDAEAFVTGVTPAVIDDILSFRLPVDRTGAGAIASLALCLGFVATLFLVLVAKVAAPLAMLAVLPGMALSFVPRRADIGTDGVALRWMGHTTLIPFTNIERVHAENATLILSVRGRRTPLRVVTGARDDLSAAGSIEALVARIARHRDAGDRSVASLSAQLDLPLADRTAWISRLRTLARSGYRELAFTPATLWDVLRDPASAEAARMSAAMLLRSGLDAEGVRRLQALAESSVSPRFRSILEQIINEPEPLADGREPRDP